MAKGRESSGTSGRAVTKDERELLEGPGAKLYEYAISIGALPRDDPRIEDGTEGRQAVELLVKLGLLNLDQASRSYVAVDPTIVSSQIVAPMSQQGAELVAESARWAQTFNGLGLAWRRSPGTKHGPFTEIQDREAINEFIRSIVNDAHDELLTAQPQTGRNLEVLPKSMQSELEAMERGVSIRTLYQHAARRSTPTHEYVATVSRHGGEVRTLDEFFNRMIVVDRQVAVIPSVAGPAAALILREPSIVAYFVDIFERAWERARPFTNRELGTINAIAMEQREMTIRMLIQGHADPSAAKRLGVSPRTYAGYVADLKDEYDAQTRFQLGYAMGRRDADGPEPDDAKDGG